MGVLADVQWIQLSSDEVHFVLLQSPVTMFYQTQESPWTHIKAYKFCTMEDSLHSNAKC